MKTIELSVIIPVYNSANRIRLLVERLQNALNDVSYEIVLVNDGSKDHSEAVCKSLAEEFHHIRFLLKTSPKLGQHKSQKEQLILCCYEKEQIHRKSDHQSLERERVRSFS